MVFKNRDEEKDRKIQLNLQEQNDESKMDNYIPWEMN